VTTSIFSFVYACSASASISTLHRRKFTSSGSPGLAATKASSILKSNQSKNCAHIARDSLAALDNAYCLTRVTLPGAGH
jgi:hypothetical protein